jgi:hypothetical protein
VGLELFLALCAMTIGLYAFWNFDHRSCSHILSMAHGLRELETGLLLVGVAPHGNVSSIPRVCREVRPSG